MPLNVESGADDRTRCAKLLLPRAVAHYDDGRSGTLVVILREDAPGERVDPEHGEIIAGDKFAVQGFRRRGCAFEPHTVHIGIRLEGRELLELGGRRLEPLEEFPREHAPSPVFREATTHAALLRIAQPEESRRIAHRQRPQHDRMHQRKDGRGRADTERQGQHHGRRKSRRQPQLAEGVANILQEQVHVIQIRTQLLAVPQIRRSARSWLVPTPSLVQSRIDDVTDTTRSQPELKPVQGVTQTRA